MNALTSRRLSKVFTTRVLTMSDRTISAASQVDRSYTTATFAVENNASLRELLITESR